MTKLFNANDWVNVIVNDLNAAVGMKLVIVND
jgi:hypothetical protein